VRRRPGTTKAVGASLVAVAVRRRCSGLDGQKQQTGSDRFKRDRSEVCCACCCCRRSVACDLAFVPCLSFCRLRLVHLLLLRFPYLWMCVRLVVSASGFVLARCFFSLFASPLPTKQEKCLQNSSKGRQEAAKQERRALSQPCHQRIRDAPSTARQQPTTRSGARATQRGSKQAEQGMSRDRGWLGMKKRLAIDENNITSLAIVQSACA